MDFLKRPFSSLFVPCSGSEVKLRQSFLLHTKAFEVCTLLANSACLHSKYKSSHRYRHNATGHSFFSLHCFGIGWGHQCRLLYITVQRSKAFWLTLIWSKKELAPHSMKQMFSSYNSLWKMWSTCMRSTSVPEVVHVVPFPHPSGDVTFQRGSSHWQESTRPSPSRELPFWPLTPRWRGLRRGIHPAGVSPRCVNGIERTLCTLSLRRPGVSRLPIMAVLKVFVKRWTSFISGRKKTRPYFFPILKCFHLNRRPPINLSRTVWTLWWNAI